MGAPGTMVEGAEKPVMRAVAIEKRRDVVEARRAKKRMIDARGLMRIVDFGRYGMVGAWLELWWIDVLWWAGE